MKTVTLTEAEARRVYELLGGSCPLDPLEQRMADKIARVLLCVTPYPKRPAARRAYPGDPIRGDPIRGNLTDKVTESLHGIN
jgi:hypothetical protein